MPQSSRTRERAAGGASTRLARGLAVLEAISRDRWRRAGLRIARAAPDADVEPAPEPDLSDVSPLEQAWSLADIFGSRVDLARGHHGTPREVACTLAELTLGDWAGRVVDPACGGGVLLLAAATQQRRTVGRVDFDALVGWDLDADAVAMSEAVIWVAAGQPEHPVGRFEVRDLLADGLGESEQNAAVVANPPWGIRLPRSAVEQWRRRVGPEIASLLEGEVNVYTLLLLEAALGPPRLAGLITPIHWLHRRSLAHMREALAATRRLRQVFVLRKRVFRSAPDMIPVLTAWGPEPSRAPIHLRRTGFAAPIPLPSPLPVEASVRVEPETWSELPFTVFPLLHSERFGPTACRLMTGFPRLSDPERRRTDRLLHIGDGAYKTRVSSYLIDSRTAIPILTRAAESGRYRLSPPAAWMSTEGLARLTPGERERFAKPKLVLHALKKAAAPWRLSVALHDARSGPLALTNNFMLGVAERYTGDLHYPLTLLNSRLYNRIYTELFPGVNIEAFAVGLLPMPWPPVETPHRPEPDSDDPRDWLDWASATAADTPVHGSVPAALYTWLCDKGRALNERGADFEIVDLHVEAVVAGLLGLSPTDLDHLLGR